jgi:glycosyltransferase involved in cell wall biosynthesis
MGRSAVLVVPGPLDTRSGGYEYDRRLVTALRARGWALAICELDPSFPRPTSVAREHAARALAALPSGTVVMVDGLAMGVMPSEVGREAARLRIVALVHHPLASETGLEPAVVAALQASEQQALASARAVVVTSGATAEALADYRVAEDRVVVVEPGTDPAPLARGSGAPDVHLLCVANLIPRKGHDLLIRALAARPERDWRLTCVGSLDAHEPTARAVRDLVRAHDLDDRVELTGSLGSAAVGESYDRADLFVLPTRHEGYGMAVAEAIARGVPVVATATGAIPGLLRGGAGILVQPGDLAGLAAALSRVLGDVTLRARMAAAAREARDTLPTWDAAAEKVSQVLGRLADG